MQACLGANRTGLPERPVKGYDIGSTSPSHGIVFDTIGAAFAATGYNIKGTGDKSLVGLTHKRSSREELNSLVALAAIGIYGTGKDW